MCKSCGWGRHCDNDRRWSDSRGPASFPRWIIPGVIESRVCLLPMVTEFASNVISMYGHYKAGYLLTAGGMLDQPNPYIEAMEILEATMNEQQLERLKSGRN